LKITTDSFFAIGKHHVSACTPCQDYAHSGMLLNGIHYAGLADGCSSSEDSDLGARALVHWMRINLRRRLAEKTDPLFGLQERPHLLSQMIRDLGLGFLRMGVPSCMDATLNFAFMHRDYEVGFVLLAGDGIVAMKKKHERAPYLFHVSWDESMPPYLSYHLHDQRRDEYKDYAMRKRLMGHVSRIDVDGAVIESVVPAWKQVDVGPFIFPFEIENTELVAVFSDGVETFHGPGQHNMMFETLVRSLTDIPSFTPGFVKRRYNLLMRSCHKAGVTHSDDFSMAAIRIDHDASDEGITQSGAVQVKPGAFAE
jgi:hypothetical protein